MTGVVLHLGLHRTGMRAVQDHFFAHRGALAQAGVIYPDLGPNRAHHVLAAPWITLPGLPEGHFGAEGPEAPWRRLAQARERAPGCLLLSAEAFSRAAPQRVDMAALAARLQVFGPVRVVLTLRAQATLLPALWLELARHRAPPVLGPFVAHALADHMAAGVWLDFNRIYDHLLEGFAPGQITVLDHARTGTPARLAEALLELAAPGRGAALAARLPFAVPVLPEAAPSGTAPSGTGTAGTGLPETATPNPVPHDIPPGGPYEAGEAHPLAVYAAARISAPAAAAAGLAARIAPALGGPLGGPLGGNPSPQPVPAPDTPSGPQPATRLLTRAEHRQLEAVFAPLNAAFEARLHPWQPGFRLTPAPAPAPGTLWRCDLTPDHWAAVATALLPDSPGLRQMAQTLTQTGPSLPRRVWRRILDISLG